MRFRPAAILGSSLLSALALAACAVPALGAAPALDGYAHRVDDERAKRLASLTKPDGWLTLIGLHFLVPGSNRVGSAPDNQIVLAAGEAHLGTVVLEPGGEVRFEAATGVETTVDGKPSRWALLRSDDNDAGPTIIGSGTVSLFLIERGGRKALRVRDSLSGRRTHFKGLDYFPLDASWRVEGRWVPFDSPRQIEITNILGNVSAEKVSGKVVFEHAGRTFELVPIQEGPDEPLFFIFGDATSGVSTYEMRFLYADPPRDGKVVLDFNLAENPPCAFTPFATCPLPPRGNRLAIEVEAGEKRYVGSNP